MHSVLIEYIFHGLNIIQWLKISISWVYEVNSYQIISFRDHPSISPLGPIINGVINPIICLDLSIYLFQCFMVSKGELVLHSHTKVP